jgi:hypothetical protein
MSAFVDPPSTFLKHKVDVTFNGIAERVLNVERMTIWRQSIQFWRELNKPKEVLHSKEYWWHLYIDVGPRVDSRYKVDFVSCSCGHFHSLTGRKDGA